MFSMQLGKVTENPVQLLARLRADHFANHPTAMQVLNTEKAVIQGKSTATNVRALTDRRLPFSRQYPVARRLLLLIDINFLKKIQDIVDDFLSSRFKK